MNDFRPAVESDLAAVASWITKSEECRLWAGWRVSFPIDLQTLPQAIAYSVAKSYVLLDDDDIAAFGQIALKERFRGHLARLIVRPDRRRKGHGSTLVRELIAVAQHSFSTMSLNVADSNMIAIQLYGKFGFTRANRPADEPETANTMYMELRS